MSQKLKSESQCYDEIAKNMLLAIEESIAEAFDKQATMTRLFSDCRISNSNSLVTRKTKTSIRKQTVPSACKRINVRTACSHKGKCERSNRGCKQPEIVVKPEEEELSVEETPSTSEQMFPVLPWLLPRSQSNEISERPSSESRVLLYDLARSTTAKRKVQFDLQSRLRDIAKSHRKYDLKSNTWQGLKAYFKPQLERVNEMNPVNPACPRIKPLPTKEKSGKMKNCSYFISDTGTVTPIDPKKPRLFRCESKTSLHVCANCRGPKLTCEFICGSCKLMFKVPFSTDGSPSFKKWYWT